MSPARVVTMLAGSAKWIMLAGLGFTVIHNLQAAEGRRVKIAVMEQLEDIREKTHKEEIAQLKTESKLAAEQDKRVEKAEAVQYEEGDIRTCPIERLRCAPDS